MRTRTKYLFLLTGICLLLYGCKSYRQQTIESGDFYSNNQIRQNTGYYDVYVHDGQNSYKMSASTLSSDTLRGTLIKANPAEIVQRPKGKKEIAKHRKEINVYLKKPIDPATINNAQKFGRTDIDRVDVYVKNKKGIFAIFAGIALLIALAAGLIYALIKLAEAGSDESSDQSGNSSNNSSNGSGCYVATMVYGSYDAPEVMVLRRFRDNFLANYSWGRAFIRWYYANSPGFVERWKDSPRVNRFIRFFLDRFVKLLSRKE